MAFKGIPVEGAVAAGKVHPWEDGEGVRIRHPPIMPLWHIDYFEVKVLTKELVQEGPQPPCSESRR